MATELQVLALLVVLVAFVTTLLVRRRRPTPLRPIDAYKVTPTLAAASIEAGQPLHVGLGGIGPGENDTVLALVAAEVAYYTSLPATVGDVSPIYTTSQTEMLPLAIDTLQRAYNARHMLEGYHPVNVRWYPSGQRALAYAGAVSTLPGDDRLASNVLIGRFGPELALMLDASQRYNVPSIAYSTELTGQAIAYALADHALIGDEVYNAGAYLSGRANLTNRSLTLDLLRWVLVFVMFVLFLINLIQQAGG